jgi:uncharacterized protein DUF1844
MNSIARWSGYRRLRPEPQKEMKMTQDLDKHDGTLLALVMNLQGTAMIQMGKMADPMSGEVTRNLEAARFTIDILEMLKDKCRTATRQEIVDMLDRSVMDLQLNYMDEMKKGDEPEADESEKKDDDQPETPEEES